MSSTEWTWSGTKLQRAMLLKLFGRYPLGVRLALVPDRNLAGRLVSAGLAERRNDGSYKLTELGAEIARKEQG